MKDYRELSVERKSEVDDSITLNNIRENSGFTIADVRVNIHDGHWCADCWMVWYNCLCFHED